MSLYWYAYCEDHKVSCEAGVSHLGNGIEFEDFFGIFLRQHSQCGVKLCCDPDPESDPDLYECERLMP